MINLRFITKVLAFLIILSFVFPAVQVGSTTFFRLDRIIQIFTLPIIFAQWAVIKKIKLLHILMFLGSLLFFFTFLSDILGNYYFLEGRERSPIRSILMISKVFIFIFFCYIVYYRLINLKSLLNFISLIFSIGLLIGFLQYIGNQFILDFSINNYVLSETQESNFTRFSRIFGTSGGIISWSGTCLLIFFYFYYLCPHRWLKIAGVSLSLLNILGAGSRSGIIALVLTFIIIQYLSAFLRKNTPILLIRNTIIIAALISISFLLFISFFPEQFEFLSMRFENAENAMTTQGRGVQMTEYINLMNSDLSNYFLGIGSTTIVEMGFLEVDFVYIIVAYGIVGVILHYALLFYICYYVHQLKDLNRNVYLFVMSITIGSLIFSAGFYFLQEIYMGMTYWWLTGISYAILLSHKRLQVKSVECGL